MAKVKIDKRKYYRESLRLYAKLSGNLTRTLDKLFKQQRIIASKRYAQNEIITDSFYLELATKLHKVFTRNVKQVFDNSKEMTERMRQIKATDEEALELYGATIGENVTQVTQTTKKLVEASIVSSLNDGLGTEDTAKRLEKSSAFSRKRARVIARTETHQAMNYANNNIAKRMNLKKPIKEWASAVDERTRNWHRSMNGTKVGINDKFMVLTPTAGGGVSERFMDYTGDPNGGASNVIQCRCFTLYYDQDDDVIAGTAKKPRKPKVKPVVIPPKDKPVTDFGDKNDPLELDFHKNSWSNSPAKYARAVKKTPSLNGVTTVGDDAYLMDISDNDRLGRLTINMGKGNKRNRLDEIIKNGADSSGANIFRHEYGHAIDAQAMNLLRINNSKFAKEFNGFRWTSTYYAEDTMKDAIDLLKKHKTGKPKKILEESFDKEVKSIVNKYPINSKQITKKEFWEDMFEDGKFFKKEELKSILGDPDLLVKNADELSDLVKESYMVQAIQLRAYNKTGYLRTGEEYKDIFGAMTNIDMRLGRNTENTMAFADFLGAMTTEKIGWGHGKGYYKDLPAVTKSQTIGSQVISLNTNNTTEMFANYTSLVSGKNGAIWKKKLEEFAPRTSKRIEEVFDALDDLPDDLINVPD